MLRFRRGRLCRLPSVPGTLLSWLGRTTSYIYPLSNDQPCFAPLVGPHILGLTPDQTAKKKFLRRAFFWGGQTATFWGSDWIFIRALFWTPGRPHFFLVYWSDYGFSGHYTGEDTSLSPCRWHHLHHSRFPSKIRPCRWHLFFSVAHFGDFWQPPPLLLMTCLPCQRQGGGTSTFEQTLIFHFFLEMWTHKKKLQINDWNSFFIGWIFLKGL